MIKRIRRTVHGITIEIENNQTSVKITKELIKTVMVCAQETFRASNIALKAIVSLVITDNNSIRQINAQFRDIDKDTDVLSFPMLDLDPGADLSDLDRFAYDINPKNGALILGDIVISAEKARDQAKEYGHSFHREMGFLVVHGMLHLLGYDHMEEEDKRLMRSMEETILSSLNLLRLE